MIQTAHMTVPTSDSATEQPRTTRDRVEHARALVIAQFGATVLVALDDDRRRYTAAPSSSR